MALLMLFALVAGAGTALSPCVLPILPAVLSAGVTGGRRRPLGVVTGLALSFTFATVGLVYVIDALGLPNGVARDIAIVVLFAFGFCLLVPPIGDRVEALASRLAPGPARFGGDGFGSGLFVGASLGLVYAPCAGPILAGVIVVSAAQDFTAGRLAVALSYAVGSAIVLYLLLLGGRSFSRRLAPVRGRVQMALGAVMVLVAVAMTANLDTRFQTAIASDLPGFLVNPTGGLEKSNAVAADLAKVRQSGKPIVDPEQLDQPVSLATYGQAPDFTDTQDWFNTPGGEPLSIGDLRGKVVLIDFWTYTCINCIRTLPYLEAWQQRYGRDGFTVVGVHSPEFPFEKDAGNVQAAIRQNHLTYPVVQDNDLGTWNAWGNQYWPSEYLVDAQGNVREAHFGEGNYDETERAIRTLLRQAGHSDLGGGARAAGQAPSQGTTTPETYLGAARAQGWASGTIHPGDQDFGPPPAQLPANRFAYSGHWGISEEDATAGADAGIDLEFNARRVFLVLGSPDRARHLRVLLDGRPIPARLAGADVKHGEATIQAQRLYSLVDLPTVGRHRLSLRFDAGVKGYAFTFG
ncbi:MAG TPA: cytochrome c biogenesis protein DipZ [Solirubrobacterales bacterium]|jgi:cytochrome c biogenesis protein CcdA/thiol-disulfide isomerase/thioredoxin